MHRVYILVGPQESVEPEPYILVGPQESVEPEPKPRDLPRQKACMRRFSAPILALSGRTLLTSASVYG